MAEEVATENPPPPTYVEVRCTSSGKARRFASGIDAATAVSLINRRLKWRNARALHIEAVKEGEEPIVFAPNSILANYGDGWKLQTFTEADEIYLEGYMDEPIDPMPIPTPVSDGLPRARNVSKPISFIYFFKIVCAFVLIFVLGAIFTQALENLPALILFVKSSV